MDSLTLPLFEYLMHEIRNYVIVSSEVETLDALKMTLKCSSVVVGAILNAVFFFMLNFRSLRNFNG